VYLWVFTGLFTLGPYSRFPTRADKWCQAQSSSICRGLGMRMWSAAYGIQLSHHPTVLDIWTMTWWKSLEPPDRTGIHCQSSAGQLRHSLIGDHCGSYIVFWTVAPSPGYPGIDRTCICYQDLCIWAWLSSLNLSILWSWTIPLNYVSEHILRFLYTLVIMIDKIIL